MTEVQLTIIATREALKHTLGNLTLLTDTRNPSLGNLNFDTKRAALSSSLLKLNREIADLPRVWLLYWTLTVKPRGQAYATGEVSVRLQAPNDH
jgi:hypothetical protein